MTTFLRVTVNVDSKVKEVNTSTETVVRTFIENKGIYSGGKIKLPVTKKRERHM